ncbi:MAG: magnesium and cobalt transport protein CorA [Rhodospirillaceae bacterium]|nr:magnesium and cobalt transport protein CorA [Rhodospirillaceae bacterium]
MLVNCIAYQDGRKLAEIQPADIHTYVSRPDCFVWVALRDATSEELNAMAAEFGLHELAVEDARHGHQRPKVEEYGEVVFAVLHLLELADGELKQGEVAIFAGPNFILSVRSRSSQNFMAVRERCEREPHLLRHGSGFVLYALIDAVVDRYFPVVDSIEADLEAIEEQIFAKDHVARLTIERLYALKQKVLAVKHAVSPLLEAVGKLYGGRVPGVCLGTQEYFRDVYDHLSRLNTSLDSLRDTVASAMQVSLSISTTAQTEVTKRLAAGGAIFAAVTAFVGIWGMNFKYMPELEWAFGYPMALTIIVGVCVFLFWRFKKSGWL